MRESDSRFTVHRTYEVHDTLACEDDTTPGLSPSLGDKSAHMRKAELAIATLIDLGMIRRNYNDPEWHLQHEAAVRAIGRVFDALEIKV
jgi:hypothetical protein